MSLLEYKKNIFSQNGEDGVLEQIFKLLNITNGTFFEFGATDGIFMSNTRQFMLKGWKGLYVEPDNNFKKLLENTKGFPVACHNEYVESSGDLTIEKHWSRAIVELSLNNSDLDFLSIDVDGFDDELLESIDVLRPKVIMIEVNAGHHPLYSKRIDRNISFNNVGQSMQVLTNIATEKGYFPICYTGNLIFVHGSVIHPVSHYVKSLESLYEEFWKSLEYNAKMHLKRTFLDTNGLYNGFTFDVSFMKKMWDKN